VPFDIPDQGEGLSDIQSIWFQEEIEVAVNHPLAGTYVKSGGLVTAQSAPNMTLVVGACVAYSQGLRFPVAASASLAIAAADATNPRLDAVVVTTTGALAVRTGTPVAFTTTTTPKSAPLSLGDVMLAQIYVPAAATAIATANIKDRRMLAPNLDWAKTEAGTYDNYLSVMPVSGSTNVSARGGGTVSTSGTVTHPQPTITNRITQLWRAMYANVATTTNQVLGWFYNSALLHKYWRGNAAGQGGFYFRGKMTIELMPAATIRYWQGMSSAVVGVSASDTLAGDLCGIWHDTTMAATVLNFVTRDNVTTNSIPITLAAPMAAGQGYELIMYCKPNDTVLYYKVIDMLTGNTLVDSFTLANLPRNTIFMSPQQNMSNGTANVTVTTVAPGVVECEVKSPAIRT
jgi:hypothetical protein